MQKYYVVHKNKQIDEGFDISLLREKYPPSNYIILTTPLGLDAISVKKPIKVTKTSNSKVTPKCLTCK